MKPELKDSQSSLGTGNTRAELPCNMFPDTESQEEGQKDTPTAGGDIRADSHAGRCGKSALHTKSRI